MAGCAYSGSKYTHSRAQAARPGVALVYGYLDMSEAPSPLQRLRVKRITPGEEAFLYFATSGDLFYHEALAPGVYELSAVEGVPARYHLGGLALLPRPAYAHALPANAARFRVREPGLHFVGSYKYKRRRDAVIAEVAVEAAPEPSEVALLKTLAQLLLETRWEEPVAKRLERLRGG